LSVEARVGGAETGARLALGDEVVGARLDVLRRDRRVHHGGALEVEGSR